jgi:hypothetical protein
MVEKAMRAKRWEDTPLGSGLADANAHQEAWRRADALDQPNGIRLLKLVNAIPVCS